MRGHRSVTAFAVLAGCLSIINGTGAKGETLCTQAGSTVTCTYQPKTFSVEDLWTSSVFKYSLNGIMDDQTLKVGGWGDTYCSYLKLAHNPPKCSLPVPGLQSQFPWCVQAPKNPLEGLAASHLCARRCIDSCTNELWFSHCGLG